MKTIEQINERFLKTIAEVDEYMKYLKQKEEYLKQPIKTVDLKTLSESSEYLKQHQDVMEEKIKWAQEEWELLTKSRTFRYDTLGRLLATILSKQEGKPYYYATRLVKHTFQLDEVNRPFYQIISFVTENEEDLKTLLLPKISSTMHVYYVNHSPVIKPLPKELENIILFEEMIRKELEVRKANDLYVVTTNTVATPENFTVLENQSLLTKFPFSYVNSVIEKLIVMRYNNNVETLSEAEVLQTIDELCKTQPNLSGVAI